MPDSCREERLRRKLAFHNERRFFWRKSSLSGKRIYSVFGPDAGFPVYSSDEWLDSTWDPLSFGVEYNSRQPFFEQLYDLFNRVPRPEAWAVDLRGATACQNCFDVSKSFCLADSAAVVRSFYSTALLRSSDCGDCLFVSDSERCYECIDCRSCRDLKFSRHSERCVNSAFLLSCFDCEDCMFCANLQGKRYCFFNLQLTADSYAAKLKDWHFEHRPGLEAARDAFATFLREQPTPQYIASPGSDASIHGNYLRSCRDSHEAFECEDCDGICLGTRLSQGKDLLDAYACVGPISHSAQIVSCGLNARSLVNCVYCSFDVDDLRYCAYCTESRHLFGCIGLRGKEYCILNRQFTAQGYAEALSHIEGLLRKKRVWGKFFPGVMSDFPYNQSSADEGMALNKYQCEMLGYRWSDSEDGFKPSQLLGAELEASAAERFSDLPPSLQEFRDEDIHGALYLCEMTGRPYQIHPLELTFYRELGVAPPARCYEQRHRERLLLLQPRRWFSRKCSATGEQMSSVFSSDTKHPVYSRATWLRLLEQ